MVRVGSVARVQSGLTLDGGRALMQPTVSRPYLRVANVQDGWVDLSEVKEVEVSKAFTNRWELRAGDVLMTEGGDADKLGRGTVWEGEIPGCLHQNHIFAVRPGKRLDPAFLGFVTQTTYARAYFEATSSKTTGIASTSTSKILSFRIPLPLIRDQIGIVSFLDRETSQIDELITAKRRMMELLEDEFRSIQSALLTGQHHHSRQKHPVFGSLPKNWSARRAKFCTDDITVGVVVNPSTYFVDDGVPFVHGTDVREGTIETTNIKMLSAESNAILAKSQLRAGDVVAMRVGYPGRAAVVPDSLNGSNCASVLIFRKSREILPELVCEFLNSPLGRAQIQAVQYGAAQEVMNVSDAVDLCLPVPPAEEQASVATRLQAARARWQKSRILLGRSVSLLQERRQALITTAVTGHLVVTGAV
jgi:type I restriction enzyme, S subunit